MTLKIMQVGEPVLRKRARPLSPEEIKSPRIQQLINDMRETMRRAPGVGLAAPQIGESLQLAVIEDPREHLDGVAEEYLAERERKLVPFHVIVNPEITVVEAEPATFFEGCLSLNGFTALVPRAAAVRVRCLNERAEPIVINARGWYARILQHEIDHLQGRIYIDRMQSRSFMEVDNYSRYWANMDISEVMAALDIKSRK
ncbi:MAG TPA: peptide deformylase [Blastocatellia bacterium]|jgi:peptide deformylase